MFCRASVKHFESMVNYLTFENTSISTESSTTSSEDYSKKEVPISIDSLPSEDSLTTTEEDEESKYAFQFTGLWGNHRFEKNPWSMKTKPFKRMRHFEDLKLTDNEKSGKLSKRMIGCCLTYLERSPYDKRYALCKCQLPEKALVDISALKTYHYIQYLDLSHNQISCLQALSEMPFLQYLDVSYNYIENAFDFKPPLYLTTVNYSNNRITRMPAMADFWSITSLDMSSNCIREIKGLGALRYLLDLNLSYNKIRMLENLSNLRLIRLNISHNILSMTENEEEDTGFNTLHHLRTVDFCHNKFNSLNFLLKNEGLENINVSNNDIHNLLEIYYLRNMSDLRTLNIKNNALCENYHFKAVCIRTIPKLRELNEESISLEERIEASTKEDLNTLIPAHITNMQLLLLEHLNRPKIGAYVCPYGDQAPSIIVIVGPPASRKKYIVKKFVEHSEFLKLGISHTTRHRRRNEVDGKDYYYTNYDHFVEMIRKGEFLTVTEFNGNLYGIAHEELEKSINCILVFYSDLETALILKMAGLQPKLVLALPRDEKEHVKWIKDTYFFDENAADLAEIVIRSCPDCLKEVTDVQEDIDDFGIFNEDNDDDGSLEIEDISSSTFDSGKYLKQSTSGQTLEVDEISIIKQETQSDHSLKPETNQLHSDHPTRISAGVPLIECTKMERAQEAHTEYCSVLRYEAPKQILNWKNYEELDISEPREIKVKTNSNVEIEDYDFESVKSVKDNKEEILSENSKNQAIEETALSGILKKDVTSQEEITEVNENLREKGSSVSDQAAAEDDQTETNKKNTSLQTIETARSGSTVALPEDDGRFSETYCIIHTDKLSTNGEYVIRKERLSTQKRVSFNNNNTEDEISYDVSLFNDSLIRDHIKSVSNTHILRSMQNRFFDNPLLSVLSSSKLLDCQPGQLGAKAKTAYTTLAERFDALKADKLGPFLAYIMLLRKELLELHYQNPGLFFTVIFTDDNINDCMLVLKWITKYIVETHEKMKKMKKESDEQTAEFNTYIANKLDKLKIYDNRYKNLYDHIDVI